MKRLKFGWIGLSMIVALAMVFVVAVACAQEEDDAEESDARSPKSPPGARCISSTRTGTASS